MDQSLLFQSLDSLPSVGKHYAAILRRMGLRRAVDLLFFFPRTYEEIAPVCDSNHFVDRKKVSFTGTVVDHAERVTMSGKHMIGFQVTPDGGGSVRLTFFNQPFRKKTLFRNTRVLVSGIIRTTGANWEMVQPNVVTLEQEEEIKKPQPIPIYPLSEGIKQSAMRRLISDSLSPIIDLAEEVLPAWLCERMNVPNIQLALRMVHFPESMEETERGLRRFKLQELLVLQLALGLQRLERENNTKAFACEVTAKIHSRILNRLPYALTVDQDLAVGEVGRDMSRQTPMNRLLQGDVGSGKTLVAQYAMLLCIANGFQAALMAPTEVLARQHLSTFTKSLASSRVRIGLLIGSMSRRERSELLGKVRGGEIDLLIGTQALLSDDVEYKQLGLVVVDEQHKFGVRQRGQLRPTGLQPHYLVLSATPIPRTVALTSFGHLEVSTIRTKPPGRAKIHTYNATVAQLDSWWEFVKKQIDQGRQAYVIAPRVAEAEEGEIASAEGVFRRLSGELFSIYRVGLLHGRLDPAEKESVLSAFSDGKVDLLVATTVVEVGIDVPNATVMTILDAQRLGLSQLHQLRGRVGRGAHPGYVCAVAGDAMESVDNERLLAFEKTDDGFELAEMDLQLRGTGDLLGTSQSGASPLRVADLVRDRDLVEEAKVIAMEILGSDPSLSNPELARLVERTLKRYGKSMHLSDVG